MTPRVWGRKLHSEGLATAHFWLATIGIVLYVVSMWVSGVTQGLMWRSVTPDGLLEYPNFIDTVTRLIPFYWIRMVGGLGYLVGVLLMAYNFIKTASGPAVSSDNLESANV
jgi:cytochrome c oxidase cbb3-type subunit I/II